MNYHTPQQVKEIADKCNALRAAAKEKKMQNRKFNYESLTAFAMRKAREAKQEVARLYAQADETEDGDVGKFLEKIAEKEAEALRWNEVA